MNSEGPKAVLEDESIERLRLILEREQGRLVDYAEAADVAESLVSFYELLATEIPDNELIFTVA